MHTLLLTRRMPASVCLPTALIEGIKGFQGGVLVVSHDQHLLSAVCQDLWLVEGGEVKKFRGTFKDYKNQVLKHVK